MNFFKHKKATTEIISAPVHVLLDSLRQHPEQWEVRTDWATHLGNPFFYIGWDTYDSSGGKLRVRPPISLNALENEELKRELLFATYTEAVKKYAKLFSKDSNSNRRPITDWKPIDTAPADKLIAVTGHYFGNPDCKRGYGFVIKRKFPDDTGTYVFIEDRSGDKLVTEYLTHWAPVDEVPE